MKSVIRTLSGLVIASAVLGGAFCPAPTGPTDPYSPSRSVCGNNRQQSGEVCDGIDLDDMTCGQLGFGAGVLGCKVNCKDFDRSGCGAPSTCGNNTTEGVEMCDGTNVNGLICEDLGLGPGSLGCLPNCGDYDTRYCAPPPDCGDNEINGSAEMCDGTDLDRLSCRSFGFAEGELRCAADCLSFDLSGCVAGSDAGGYDTSTGYDANTGYDATTVRRDAGLPDTARPDTWQPDRAVPWDPAKYGAPCSADSQCTDQGACIDAYGTGSVCWKLCSSVSQCSDFPYSFLQVTCAAMADGYPQVCYATTGQNSVCGNSLNALCDEYGGVLCAMSSDDTGYCVRPCNPHSYTDSYACRVDVPTEYCGCTGSDHCSVDLLAFESGVADDPDGVCATPTSVGSWCGVDMDYLEISPCTDFQVCEGLSDTDYDGTCGVPDGGFPDAA